MVRNGRVWAGRCCAADTVTRDDEGCWAGMSPTMMLTADECRVTIMRNVGPLVVNGALRDFTMPGEQLRIY